MLSPDQSTFPNVRKIPYVITDTLDLPHPQMHKRDFVLLPMRELVPEWKHPITHKSLTQLIEALDEHSILGPLGQNPEQVINLP